MGVQETGVPTQGGEGNTQDMWEGRSQDDSCAGLENNLYTFLKTAG